MIVEMPALSEREFALLRDLIYSAAGITLNPGKKHLVQARLQKRLRHHDLNSYEAYYRLVAAGGSDSPELAELINCVTTNKTDFFREPHHFEFVARRIVPALITQAAQGKIARKLRVWHAGCSTGEEPYTLAITLAEALAGQSYWDVRQLASDIDTRVLAYAERGVYARSQADVIPPALLHKYFLRGTGPNVEMVRAQSRLREQIRFRQINLLADPWPLPPRVRFDMIFCRNVVIYFDRPTQKRLFARFEQVLKPGGYLFIGHSESLLGLNTRFQPVGGTIYRLPEIPGKGDAHDRP